MRGATAMLHLQGAVVQFVIIGFAGASEHPTGDCAQTQL